MLDNPIITLLLAPLLLIQGLLTRLVTPKLPEPKGDRKGVSGIGKPLRLLILGDSAAAGVGVARQQDALSGQIVEKLAPYASIEWRLEAETGSKTADIIERLDKLHAFQVDVVVVSLGVNDVTSNVKIDTWLNLQEQLRSLLVTKFKASVILLSSVPPMEMFPALPQPLRWYLGRKSKAFNIALSAQVEKFTELQFLNTHFPNVDGYIAKDGFHPSGLAYGLWSDQLVEEIKRATPDINYVT